MDLIINLRARMLARDGTLADSLTALASGRARIHLTRTAAELSDTAARLAHEGTDLVLLAGGDGSLMAGVSALHAAFDGDMPPIAPIPAGTAGTIARNWGISGDPLTCLRRALDGPRRLVPRPSLRVVEQTPAGEPLAERIGFIVGTGLVARFFRVYYAHGAPGYAGSAKLVARIFAESFVGGRLAKEVLEPLPCQLHVDGVLAPPSAWSLVCCSTVPNLGIHMLLNYRAAEDPLRPHLVATPMLPRQLGPRAPLVLSGRPLGGPHLVDSLVRDFRVVFPGETGPYVLDGELLDAPSVAVQAGPLIDVATPS